MGTDPRRVMVAVFKNVSRNEAPSNAEAAGPKAANSKELCLPINILSTALIMELATTLQNAGITNAATAAVVGRETSDDVGLAAVDASEDASLSSRLCSLSDPPSSMSPSSSGNKSAPDASHFLFITSRVRGSFSSSYSCLAFAKFKKPKKATISDKNLNSWMQKSVITKGGIMGCNHMLRTQAWPTSSWPKAKAVAQTTALNIVDRTNRSILKNSLGGNPPPSFLCRQKARSSFPGAEPTHAAATAKKVMILRPPTVAASAGCDANKLAVTSVRMMP
mmetsp:Transcript_69521/g.166667  ORF Transcript_69521/g.166667 Transcript_69521/m.166667 type:complete len:278 (+) Transcript_69521:1058-1891(+)